MKYIYQRVRDTREDRELSQEQIAKYLKTHTTTYRRWETGETEIPVHILKKLSKLYEKSIDYLTEIMHVTES